MISRAANHLSVKETEKVIGFVRSLKGKASPASSSATNMQPRVERSEQDGVRPRERGESEKWGGWTGSIEDT